MFNGEGETERKDTRHREESRMRSLTGPGEFSVSQGSLRVFKTKGKSFCYEKLQGREDDEYGVMSLRKSI